MQNLTIDIKQRVQLGLNRLDLLEKTRTQVITGTMKWIMGINLNKALIYNATGKMIYSKSCFSDTNNVETANKAR